MSIIKANLEICLNGANFMRNLSLGLHKPYHSTPKTINIKSQERGSPPPHHLGGRDRSPHGTFLNSMKYNNIS